MGIFSKKSGDKLKYRSKEFVDRGEFRGNAVVELDMPDSVRVISEDAFRACRSLKTARLSKQVCEIGDFAFRDCDSLESVTFPAEMRYPDGSNGVIGIGCFEGCGLLREAVIPEGVGVISSNAFHNCAALERVVLPKSLRAIQAGAFAGCARLKTLEMPVFPDLVGLDSFNDTIFQEEIQAKRKPVLTITHYTVGKPRIFQFCAVSRLIGVEQTEDDMAIILDVVDKEKVVFRIANYSQAGGTHTVKYNVPPTRLFYEEYDCQGRGGFHTEEITAMYR